MINIFKKLQRKSTKIALLIIEKYMSKQSDISLYAYQRKLNKLIPMSTINYQIRYITSQNTNSKLSPNSSWDCIDIDSLIGYSNKVVIDVGAQVGYTAIPFSEKASVVYAFEPKGDSYFFLLEKIKIHNVKNIKTYNFAVSNFNGTANFYSREDSGVNSLSIHHNHGSKVLSSSKVKVMKLDDFWKENINAQIGLLKIDVEGFEVEVLEGCSYLLENNKIDTIIFEFSPEIHKLRGIEIDAPIQILKKYNYNLFTIDGNDFLFDKANYPKLCDLIAQPKK